MASASLTRVTLELGGNDAGRHPRRTRSSTTTHLDRLFAAIFDTTGQICMNAKRLYVHRSRMDEVVTRAVGAAARRRSSATASTRAPRWARCTSPRRRRSSTRSSRRRRIPAPTCWSSASCRAASSKGGNFLRPAIVVDPDPSLRVVTQEQFGPVIPVIPFDDRRGGGRGGQRHLGRPVRLGLDGRCRRPPTASAASWSCGYVWVNDHGATRLDLRAPFGGMKQSGMGREQGIEGVRAFQDTRSIAHLDAATLATMHH